MGLLRSLGWFSAGFAASPFLEYGWHAWLAHRPSGDPTRDEHLEHHRTAYEVADPWGEIREHIPALAKTSLKINLVAAPVLGFKRSLPLTAGLLAGYAFSTLYHAQMHQRGPETPYEEWMWKFHFYHHFQDAKTNFGLTNPVFDFLFGTAIVPEEIVVPEKLAPCWLKESRPGFKMRRPKSGEQPAAYAVA